VGLRAPLCGVSGATVVGRAAAGVRMAGLVVAGAMVAVPVLAIQLSAQTTVQSARLYADLSPDDGGAEVRIEYVLDVQGTPELQFELLGFGSASADGFWLGEERTGTRIELDPQTGSMRAATFTLTLANTSEPYRLVAQYWIAEAVQLDGEDVLLRVPVLSIALPPADGVPDLFRAELRLPPDWSVTEGFPTGLEVNDEGVYTVSLPVVPSMVSARGRTDGTWRPGLPLLIDVLTVLVLLAFSFVGWRHLSRVAA
jgi:hypothetical protein